MAAREQIFEQPLPSNSEAEKAVLGAVLLDNALIAQAIEFLKPEDFYVPSHRRIYVAMIALFERGSEINPILIGEELKKDASLESAGGISFVTNLTYGLPHSTNILDYCKVIRSKSLLRRLVRTLNYNLHKALAEEEDAQTIFDNAQRDIFELGDEQTRQGFSRPGPIAQDMLERIQNQEGRVITGLPTGFKELDEKTSGMQKGEMIILAARPSLGKTAFALMAVENLMEMEPGAVVAIFSLEMSKEALVMRMLCAHANIDAQRFRNGFLSKAEWAKIAKSLGVMADWKLFLDDTPAINSLDIRAKSRNLAVEQKRLDLIVIDYLQLMSGDPRRRFESRQQEVSQISREIKSIAKELKVPALAISQLSRKPENRSDPRPVLADLRESGALEQDADVVQFIFSEEQYMTAEEREISRVKNIKEIIVAKQRSGPTGTIRLRWTPSSMRFDDIFEEQ